MHQSVGHLHNALRPFINISKLALLLVLSGGGGGEAAAVMVHTGATVIDSLPQGTYFHVTADSIKMSIKQRMGLIP